MTRSNKRKKVKNTAHHASHPKPKKKGNHVFRVFLMYFVIFGAILSFVGYMGDDALPDAGWFIWLLGAMNIVISIIATVTHFRGGHTTKIDELADKW